MRVSRRVVASTIAATVLVAAGGTIAAFEITGNPFDVEPVPLSTLTPMPTPAAEPPEVVLAGSPDRDVSADLVALLDESLDDPRLGGRVGAVVADLVTGEVLYDRNGDVPMTPASTMKLITGAAVLEVLGEDHRFRTEAVLSPDGDSSNGDSPDGDSPDGDSPDGDSPDGDSSDGDSPDGAEVVLIGGGDPVLVTDDPMMRRSTTLSALADAVAEHLVDAGIGEITLGYDDTLFSGPAIDPDWRSTYVPFGVAAPVTALSVDGGRTTPGQRARTDDPALFAAEVFRDLLAERGITVTGEPTASDRPDGVEPIVAVESAPLDDIVEYMIASSDNDVAEILARHVALGLERDGSSAAASDAVVDVLDAIGLDVSGLTVLDGSGLARGSAVPAAALVELLAVASQPDQAHLRSVLTGLPVAAFDGTLSERVEDAPGLVRAKTGTLTGVHALAGVATAPDGSAYVFALLADDAPDALAARAGLDAVAAALAGLT